MSIKNNIYIYQGDRTAAYHLSWVYLEQGDLTGARRMCGEAIAGCQEQMDTRGLSDAYEQLAAILTEENRSETNLAWSAAAGG